MFNRLRAIALRLDYELVRKGRGGYLLLNQSRDYVYAAFDTLREIEDYLSDELC